MSDARRGPRSWRPLAGLTWRGVPRDVLAGITLVAIAVPLNIGYAQIAGLPATAGLYGMVVPVIVYALVVSSRHVVASPDAAAAALVASSIGGLAIAGSADYLTMAFAQAIISGALFLLAAVFKLGFLANFLSKPILVGFVGGLALDILVSQVGKMLGLVGQRGGDFVGKVVNLVLAVPGFDPWSVGIAAVSVAVLLVGRRIAETVPWALIVLVLASVAVVVGGLDERGVAVLGPVPSGPPTLAWPMLDWETWLALVPSAIALTLITTAEGLLVARRYAAQHDYRVSANRDLFAYGLANVASGVTGSFAVGSSTSRSAAVEHAGGRSQLPSIVAAVATLALLLFGTGVLERIPSPAIGAIVAVAVLRLLGIGDFRELWRQDRYEFAIAAACFLTTVFAGAIPGIVVALALALINLARRASVASLEITGSARADPLDTPVGDVLVIRLGAPLFFANAEAFVDGVQAAVAADPDEVKHVVINLDSLSDVDATAADSFAALRAWLTERGIGLAFSRPRDSIVGRLRELDLLRDEPVFPTNLDALETLSRDRRR